MNRGYIALIIGAVMLILGYVFGKLIPDQIVPTSTTNMTNTDQTLLSLSNIFSKIGQWGIVILVLGGFMYFIERMKTK